MGEKSFNPTRVILSAMVGNKKVAAMAEISNLGTIRKKNKEAVENITS